jgi:hypothetical protein
MRHLGGLTALVLVVLFAPAALAGPPAGATARCADGTFSYSLHHSGTCSHHGGVAQWLHQGSVPTTGSVASSSKPTAICVDGSLSYSQHRSGTCSRHGGVRIWLSGAPTTGSSSSAGTGSAQIGQTMLLEPRTKTQGCKRGPMPDRRCSPGAYYSGLTKAVICSGAFRTSAIRNVPDSEKHAVEEEYGMAPGSYGRTIEIDHIVSLELGGSNDIANLFPEPGAGAASYHVKDVLENKLHDLVCSGALTLSAAQRGIASNWQALYRRVFGASSG